MSGVCFMLGLIVIGGACLDLLIFTTISSATGKYMDLDLTTWQVVKKRFVPHIVGGIVGLGLIGLAFLLHAV